MGLKRLLIDRQAPLLLCSPMVITAELVAPLWAHTYMAVAGDSRRRPDSCRLSPTSLPHAD
jgi:hypothetical protein